MLFNLLSLGLSGGALATALVHQHLFGMEPCAWCVLQRLVFVLIFLVSALSLVFKKQSAFDWLVAALGVSGVGIAFYQLNVANHSNSCGLSAAEKFMTWTQLNSFAPPIFESYALCAEANVSLLGLPYAAWSLWLFGIITLLSLKKLPKMDGTSNEQTTH